MYKLLVAFLLLPFRFRPLLLLLWTTSPSPRPLSRLSVEQSSASSERNPTGTTSAERSPPPQSPMLIDTLSLFDSTASTTPESTQTTTPTKNWRKLRNKYNVVHRSAV